MMSRIKSFKAEVLSIELHETHNFFQRTLQEFWEEQKALNERMIALTKLLDTCLLLCTQNCAFQVMPTYWFFLYAQHWGATVALGTLPLNRYSCFHLESLGSHLTQLCLYIHTKETWLKYWEEKKKKMTPKKKGMQAKKYSRQKCHLERYRLPLTVTTYNDKALNACTAGISRN